jgi:hypothetical protein
VTEGTVAAFPQTPCTSLTVNSGTSSGLIV